jgi:hypothetical protein
MLNDKTFFINGLVLSKPSFLQKFTRTSTNDEDEDQDDEKE